MPAITVPGEVLAWSLERPGWQRDALRRLFAGETIAPESIGDLVDICKAAHGLVEPKAARPLTEQDLPIQARETESVSLVSVTHHRGVNALANEQTVAFGPHLTVVYGRNAAGKSGYTRILKRACRSRGRENILGNVLSGEVPLAASATITFKEGSDERVVSWTHDGAASETLASVSVFDAQSAAVYLRDKTDVAFRPYGLDVFDKLSALCAEVRQRLEQEQRQLSTPVPGLPVLPNATRARQLLDGLTGLTRIEDVRTLATLSGEEHHALNELRSRMRDFQSSDPKQRARELALKAERLAGLAKHVNAIAAALGNQSLTDLRGATDALRSANDALAIVRSAAFSGNVLQGTGGEQWGGMWEAARRFAAIAYPATDFPNTTNAARCPLCQQTLENEASQRLSHFAAFVTSRAHGEARTAESAYRSLIEKNTHIVIEPPDATLAIKELDGEDTHCAERVKRFLSEARAIHDQVSAAAKGTAALPARGLDANPASELRVIVDALKKRASDLHGEVSALNADEEIRLKDLESRVQLNDAMQLVIDEIERKKRVAAYRQCLDDTNTQAITRKSTELTKELVTDRLRSTFSDELAKLDFTHLLVEVRAVGGARGLLYHRIEFSNAPGVAVTDVLSEGESRALSLAAFMTELSTATSNSAIIFDDPVSSLDHYWRDRIARRLVSEAKTRQVVVFTHDLLFLRFLLDESAQNGVPCVHQYLRRNGQPGQSSSSLPWMAMRVSDRIGRLRTLWQAAEKLHRTESSEAYERDAREIYGLLREAWEQAVVEVLLNEVVERYRPSVQTQKVKDLHDITADDCKAVNDAMTECSRWIRGHDSAAADGTPVPGPSELQKCIDGLEVWVKAIRKRRN